MNPMQLLTVSKSLMGIKDATGRYRMAEGNLLPKFNSTIRVVPPAPMAKAEAVRPAMELSIEDQSTARPEAKSKKSTTTPVLTQAREIILKRGLFALEVCSKACSSMTSVLEKIKPLSYLKDRQTRAKPQKIKSVKPALQGELSLDRIKVIRNDLSDTDLEIVPVTHLEQPKRLEPVRDLEAGSAPTKAPWGRLMSRIFGVGQTPF